MGLKTITCSGADEHTDAKQLIWLLNRYKRAELGIQVSGEEAAFSTARYWWIENLFRTLEIDRIDIPIALHVNSDWVEDFCQNKIHSVLKRWLNSPRYGQGKPFIRRVQLNFKIGREKKPDLQKLLQAIETCPRQQFIFSYNEANSSFIQQVYKSGQKFDLLCDDSHGNGILPEKYLSPIYPDILQGYAGGLSPENVKEQLYQINKVVPRGKSFTIDAEEGLKGEDGHLSLEKCETYLNQASDWAEL